MIGQLLDVLQRLLLLLILSFPVIMATLHLVTFLSNALLLTEDTLCLSKAKYRSELDPFSVQNEE